MPQPPGKSAANGRMMPPSVSPLRRLDSDKGSFTKGMRENAVLPPSLPQRLIFRRVVMSPKPRGALGRSRGGVFRPRIHVVVEDDLQVHAVKKADFHGSPARHSMSPVRTPSALWWSYVKLAKSISSWKWPASTVYALSVWSGRSVLISRISARGVG